MIDVPLRTVEQIVSVEDGWNRDEVRRPLWEHYLYKCYLCERLIEYGEFQIEHRVPHKAFRHCWFNLFPACVYCNGRKADRYPQIGGLLSPGLDARIESRIQQRIEQVSGTRIRVRFSAINSEDLYAHNTAEELERLHDPDTGRTTKAEAAALDLLDSIEDWYNNQIFPTERKALRARLRGQPDKRAEAELRRKLARDQPFAMLMRSKIDRDLADLIDS